MWAAQGLKGALVLTTSVNGVVSKRGSLAYDASKAAANHLVRELAIELAPLVRVNAMAPADGTIAPAGHYLLFLVDHDRTPSEGVWIRVTP